MTFLYSSGHFAQFLAKICFSKLAVGVTKQQFSIHCLTFDVITSKNGSHCSPLGVGVCKHEVLCTDLDSSFTFHQNSLK